jgi:hypothetical protein
VRFSEILPDTGHIREPPETNWNIDIHGALAREDGSVVFSFEWGGLVKFDRCGNVVGALPRETHHSVERAESGGYWVPARRFHVANGESPFPPFELGKSRDREIVHLNKIEELTRDIADHFPMFGAGDLALSIREINMIVVMSPETDKVKWWRIGPSLR